VVNRRSSDLPGNFQRLAFACGESCSFRNECTRNLYSYGALRQRKIERESEINIFGHLSVGLAEISLQTVDATSMKFQEQSTMHCQRSTYVSALPGVLIMTVKIWLSSFLITLNFLSSLKPSRLYKPAAAGEDSRYAGNPTSSALSTPHCTRFEAIPFPLKSGSTAKDARSFSC
jgi:hypothetical protein